MNAGRCWRTGVRMLWGGLLASALAGTIEAQVIALQPPARLKQLTVEELLRTKVLSVSRTPQELRDVPSSLYLVRGEAVRGSGATSLPELLRLAPNLFVAQASAYDWAVGARGFTRASSRVNKMQVLIDGRTVYSPLFSGVFWDSQDVFLPDLDRIEVISGPAGVSWGANAVNGVINITTKSARDTQGGLAYAGLGSELEANVGLRYGGRIGRGDYYRVYAKHRSYDDSFAANSADRDAWEFTQGGFRIDGGNERAALEWTIQGDAYSGTYHTPTTSRARNEGANLLARWTAHLTGESQVALRIYHDYTLRRVPDVYQEYLRTTDVEFQHQLRPRHGHQVVWGANYRYLNEEAHIDTDTFAIVPTARDMRLGGVFVQDVIDLGPDVVRLTPGVRVEHNTFSGWEQLPSLRAAWQVAPEHTLWAAVSRATRTPSRIDTDLRIPAEPPYQIVGSANFHAEELTAYELGWRGQLARSLAGSLTASYHDYDYLRSLETGAPLRIANGLRGHSTGLEAFLDWQVADDWRLRIGGFVLDEGTKLRPGATDVEAGLGEASDPDYQILVRSAFNLRPDLFLWLSLRCIGSVPVYANGVSAGAVPAYQELDATLRWTVRGNVEVSLVGRNLLHSSHPEIGPSAASRHEVERSIYTTIQWEF